jgi:predicted phage terminase large subunit-like protein
LEKPHGRCWVIGTRYALQDWYGGLIEANATGAWERVIVDRAIREDGTSYWESKHPLAQLERDRARDPRAFATQYQQDASVHAGTTFTAAMTGNQAIFEDLPQGDRAKARTIVALDPATKTGAHNDFSAFCVASIVPGIPSRFYVRRVLRGRWTQKEIVERAASLFEFYKPEHLACEAVAGQEFLADSLRQRGLRVKSVVPGATSGKRFRIERLLPHFEDGHVYIAPPSLATGTADLIDEMLAYPKGAHDDTVDAMVWALSGSTVARTRLVRLHDRRHL